MTALQAFEAAYRHQSFTLAAEELGRTQGAISRQVAILEAHLGVELFVREHPRLRPTAAARSFGVRLRTLLDRLSALTLELQASGGAGSILRLAILPTFGTRWLIPRMPAFYAKHPEVSVHFTTHVGTFDFDNLGLDAAIHHGEAVWPGARLEELMHESVTVVCTPARAKGLADPRELLDDSLLQLASRRDAWGHWFRENGIDGVQAVRGPMFEQHLMVIQAAIAGLGVAIVPEFLVRDELSSGALVEPFPERRVRGTRAYYLAYPETSRELPGLVRFRRWILDEFKDASSTMP